MIVPHLLHVFSVFQFGGAQARALQLVNSWGGQHRHSIVSIVPGELGAREHLDPALNVDFPLFPDLKSDSLPRRLLAVRRRLLELKPDLVLTYNWGAMEVVMAARLFGLGPLVHHEDGFGPDEAVMQKSRRVWFRRLALPGAARVVVPSRRLEVIARDLWWQSSSRISHVANGVDVAPYDLALEPSALPGLDRRDGVLQVGTVAGLRPEKNLRRLVRVFALAAGDLNARLVIVGTGPERSAILAEAAALGIADKVCLTGFLPAPHRYMGLFDVFALTSDTEQFPISLVEAMAARLPAVCTDVGDIRTMLPADNQAFLHEREGEAALASSMRALLTHAELRKTVGAANRAKVERDYSLTGMVERYERIYMQAMSATG